MFNPKVAVLVATFNGEKFIASQLASLFGQVGVDVSVIVRDDGSTDSTLEQVVLFKERFPNKLDVRGSDEYVGGSAGRNFFALLRGLTASDYDYVALCDQDDIWSPVKLVSAIRKMEESASAGYSSNLIAFDETRQTCWFIKKSGAMRELDYLFQSASAGCTYVLSRQAVVTIQSALDNYERLPPRILSHDYVIYAICRANGLRWIMDDAAYIFYRQHDANAFSAMPGLWGLWQRWRLAREGWFGKNIACVAELLVDDPQATAVFERLTRSTFADRLWLAMQSRHYRRRRRDQLLLATSILLGQIGGKAKMDLDSIL
jgi:rhamnosyltransferase